MPLSIKDPETDRLARELAAATGESLTEAIREALRERLRRVAGRSSVGSLEKELREIDMRCGALPIVDNRPADVILGYDDHGLPR